MEVHAHTHTARKKWTHYFWEFLMLFLAVFCGFFAENLREHQVEHQREKQFMKTLIKDLELDIAGINDKLNVRQQTREEMAFVINRLSVGNIDSASDSLYYFSRHLLIFGQFATNDRTIIQLRNAGNMRLIRNQNVSDSILSYYKIENVLAFYYSVENDIRMKLRELMGKIFDGYYMDKMVLDSTTTLTFKLPDFKPPLLSKDGDAINQYKMQLHLFRSVYYATMTNLSNYKHKARELIDLIKKEYHLQ